MPSPVAVLDLRSADAASLDRVRPPEGWIWVRLRPDRALAVSLEPQAGSGGVAEAIARDHADIVVVDVSAGWTATSVSAATLPRLTASPVPDPARPWAGAIAGVPALAIPDPDGWVVLTGASYEAHIAAAVEPNRATSPARRVEVGR